MSKIIRTVNTMIQNPHKIIHIIRKEDEYFFLYNKKYKWSISKSESGAIGELVYYLNYYPGEITIEKLSEIEVYEWESHDFISYNTKELKSREAKESFLELYRILKEKIYNMDKVFDEIIKDGEEDPF